MLSINSNALASSIANMLNQNSAALDQTAQRIATGKRILTAADDPAGMGILSTLNAQSSSYVAVQKNLSAGNSLLNVASSSLSSQQDIMSQMKDLATQAASATLTTAQRTALGSTFTELQTQLDAAVNNASLFGQNLTGSAGAAVVIQSGVTAGSTYTINAAKSDAATLKIDAATIDLSTTAKAQAAMTAIDAAVGTVAANQSVIGAQQNGIAEIIKSTTNTQQNLTSSIASIQNVDMAAESAKLTQLQAKQQLTTSMLSIANQLPNYLLQLIK
jgi:flagellin